MRKITETLSKEVVAAAEGEIVGIVTNAYVDPKLTRIRGYKVSSEDRDTGRLLPLRKLHGLPAGRQSLRHARRLLRHAARSDLRRADGRRTLPRRGRWGDLGG